MPWFAHSEDCQATAGALAELPIPTVVPGSPRRTDRAVDGAPGALRITLVGAAKRLGEVRPLGSFGVSSQGSFEQMNVEEVLVQVVDRGEGSCRLRPGQQERHAEGKGDECDVGGQPELQG
jgi:hypothetical protein